MSISRLSVVLQINYDVPKGIHELYSLLEKGLQDDKNGDVVSFREGLDGIKSEINDSCIKETKSMTEKEKMIAGRIYDPSDKELVALRAKAHRLSKEYNELLETDERRTEIIKELGIAGDSCYFQGPVQFDYGCFTSVGKNFYANFNFTCVDCCPVTIGDNVFVGPNVSLLTPIHPLRWQDRNQYLKQDGTPTDKEYAKPITIGSNCWIAGNVTICGGVTIGEGCVIGAGSVVTRDIPPNSLAVGVPCRVVREITEADSLDKHPELF